jgi:hypothetical protein
MMVKAQVKKFSEDDACLSNDIYTWSRSDGRHASKKCLGVYSFTLDLLLASLVQYSLQISFNLIIAHATAQVDSSYHGDVLIVISVLPH